ncbi:MAG: polyprenyl synthetase family protein [Tannerellaceae bacterium]|jgi:geranylgeranyl diphosphate synthase type II|nr:polyprenyl synthetase family protein [Tannerellaceae bacterium]
MLSFDEILQRIEHEVSRLHFNYSPNTLYIPIEYILSLGGKRVRPALTLIACNIYKDDIDDAIAPALSLEVFHNFTLLHDDLMDQADKRRNNPTVHKIWNANTAILSGDAMVIASYKIIADSKPEFLKELIDLFTTTALEICGGQQYDMEFESRSDVSEVEYIEMIRLKTAVLLACGLKMGAIVGGASKHDAAHLYQYGLNIGLAFQLKDDLLDVYGDPDTFGKNIGGDILCNKKTFLLINALKKASPEQQRELHQWLAKEEFEPTEKIETFKEIYNELGLKEMTESKIQDYYNKALAHFSCLNVPEEKLSVLKEVSNMLLYRES